MIRGVTMIMMCLVSRPMPTFLNSRLRYGILLRTGGPNSLRPSDSCLQPAEQHRAAVRADDGRVDGQGGERRLLQELGERNRLALAAALEHRRDEGRDREQRHRAPVLRGQRAPAGSAGRSGGRPTPPPAS